MNFWVFFSLFLFQVQKKKNYVIEFDNSNENRFFVTFFFLGLKLKYREKNQNFSNWNEPHKRFLFLHRFKIFQRFKKKINKSIWHLMICFSENKVINFTRLFNKVVWYPMKTTAPNNSFGLISFTQLNPFMVC